MFGAALHTRAPEAFRTLFEAEGGRPLTASGLADRPRPFILRGSQLDGRTIGPGESFWFDAHVFDAREAHLPQFRMAFRSLSVGQGRAELDRVEQFDLEDRNLVVEEQPGQPCTVVLDAPEQKREVQLRFVTPTELKSGGELVREPGFAILMKRLRDRIGALRALYGDGPLEIDFRTFGERAEAVRLVRADLHWETTERRSARTGQVHPIGGFTGEAEYEGEVAEFMPWLRAARWVGVGRQTVWGKGDVRVVE